MLQMALAYDVSPWGATCGSASSCPAMSKKWPELSDVSPQGAPCGPPGSRPAGGKPLLSHRSQHQQRGWVAGRPRAPPAHAAPPLLRLQPAPCPGDQPLSSWSAIQRRTPQIPFDIQLYMIYNIRPIRPSSAPTLLRLQPAPCSGDHLLHHVFWK